MKKCISLVVVVLLSGWFMETNAQQNKPKSAFVSLKARFPVPGNKLRLILMKQYLFNSYESNPHLVTEAKGTNGIFRFDVRGIEELSYFIIQISEDTLNGEPSYIGEVAYLEPGDSVAIDANKGCNRLIPGMEYYLSYSGRGANKLDCLESLRKAALFQSGTGVLLDSSFLPTPDYYINFKQNVMTAVLANYHGLMSSESFDLLVVDAKYMLEGLRMDDIRRRWIKSTADWQKVKIKTYLDSLMAIPPLGSEQARVKSKHYANAFLRRAIAKNLSSGQSFSYNQVFADMKKEPALVRDRLVMELFSTIGPILKDRDSLLEDARSWATSSAFREFLEKFSRNKEGDLATDFILSDVQGHAVKLSDFRGKVVLMDFWFTGCAPCAMYYKNELKPVHQQYANNRNLIFISISVDRSRQKWLKSIASHQYTDSSVVNLYTNGKGEVHETVQAYNVIGYPSPILIDQRGRIVTLHRDKLMSKEKLKEGIDALLADERKPSSNRGVSR